MNKSSRSPCAPTRSELRRVGLPARSAAAGFTALELMVVLAVTGILLAIAVPSFTQLIQRNRLATKANAFIGDLQFARAEAIKRGQPVTVCASSDGLACLGTATWSTGWIVFGDPDNTKTRDSSKVAEAVLRTQPSWAGSDTFTASSSTAAITYSRDGFALGLSGTVTWTMRTTPQSSDTTRCVTVSIVGRQQVQSPNGSNCT